MIDAEYETRGGAYELERSNKRVRKLYRTI